MKTQISSKRVRLDIFFSCGFAAYEGAKEK